MFVFTTVPKHSERPGIFKTDDDKNEFIDFITKLSNATFENYEELPMNRTFGISSNHYLDLLWNLSFPFSPEINSGTANKLYLQDTITELGICYSVNSKMSVYNSYRYLFIFFLFCILYHHNGCAFKFVMVII